MEARGRRRQTKNIPRRTGQWSLNLEVVLEAQFYTRRVGRIWSKMITAARGDDPKTTAARGVDTKGVFIQGRRDWYYDWYFDWYY